MISRRELLLSVAAAPLVRAVAADPKGPFQPSWESLKEHYHSPAWFADSKFGIFIHWGLYAIPARGESYAKLMYTDPATIAWHRQRFGAQDKFGYKDFIPRFKAEKFNPDEWAALFKRAGARYVMPVA